MNINYTEKKKFKWVAGFVGGAIIVWLILYIAKPSFVLIKDPTTGLNTASINSSTMGLWVLLGGIVGALLYH